MLKSGVNYKSLGGMKCDELKLPPEDFQMSGLAELVKDSGAK